MFGIGWFTSPLAKGLGALLLAVLAASGTYFSPWFQEHWDPPSKSVSFGAVCLESGVTRGSFYSAAGVTEAKVQDSELQGLLVSVALTASGFDGTEFYLRSDVLNDVSGVEALGSRLGLDEHRIIPVDASTVMRDPQIWVPLPAAPGRYVVQIRAYEESAASGNQGLASAYSSTFVLNSNDAVALSALCTKG